VCGHYQPLRILHGQSPLCVLGVSVVPPNCIKIKQEKEQHMSSMGRPRLFDSEKRDLLCRLIASGFTFCHSGSAECGQKLTCQDRSRAKTSGKKARQPTLVQDAGAPAAHDKSATKLEPARVPRAWVHGAQDAQTRERRPLPPPANIDVTFFGPDCITGGDTPARQNCGQLDLP
jgi:hypothetical protein